MRKTDIRGDSPTTDRDDQLKVEAVAHPFRFKQFLDETKITEQIVEAINRMGGAGASAEEEYQLCIDKLSRNTKQASAIIREEYFDVADDQYLDRWSLIMLAIELKDGSNIELFEKVLTSALPEEKSKDPHSGSTVGEETMIRTTIIEGLEQMAQDGDEKATDLLWRNIEHDSFSIRRAATQALIAVGDDDILGELKKKLPQRHHNLLDLRRTDVREAEQAEGGLFLKNHDDGDIPEPNDQSSGKDIDD